MSNYPNETRADITTRSDDPEVIRRDIESTRADLSRDVDALTEKVSPRRVMHRNVDKAKGRLASVKESVMGSSEPSRHRAAGAMTDRASSMASTLGETASSAPEMARRKTEGNPLAAGLIAFGAGWLASSLLPASEKEQQAAQKVKATASQHSDTLTAPIKEAAGAAKENLQGPAKDAVQTVRDRATEAAAEVKGQAVSAKDDLAGSARNASHEVRSTT